MSKLLQGLKQSGDLGSWFDVFREALDQPWFPELMAKVFAEYKGKDVTPNPKDIFRAFRLCSPQSLKVVLLGQDPYPYPYVADGLAFSTMQLQRPVSLINIVLEARKDFPVKKLQFSKLHYWNDLSQWSRLHGVLLLNTALTCKYNAVGSHSKIWAPFMENIIPLIKPKVFVLMGREAEKYGRYIPKGVKILTCPHPAARDDGFRDCDIFRKINDELQYKVNWGLFKEDCIHAGLYAEDTLLGSIPGCFYMHAEISKEINGLVGKKVEEIAFLEPRAQNYLKLKINPDYMDGNDVHKFYNEVLTTAMNLPDETIITSFKLINY